VAPAALPDNLAVVRRSDGGRSGSFLRAPDNLARVSPELA
jgi:hypothetical protein